MVSDGTYTPYLKHFFFEISILVLELLPKYREKISKTVKGSFRSFFAIALY